MERRLERALDLSKAFDTVDHVLLVEKLKTIGSSSQVVKWLSSCEVLESTYGNMASALWTASETVKLSTPVVLPTTCSRPPLA